MRIYYKNDNLIIRSLIPSDASLLASGERAQGWHTHESKFETRIHDEADGKCITFCAELDSAPVGYVSLYFREEFGPYSETGWPEIVDFGVLEKHRRQGIGTALMDCAENEASKLSDYVAIGVGLHSGYGSAQRMYVKRGYIPDGSGVWYQDKPCPQYTPCENNDELILHLSKKLR